MLVSCVHPVAILRAVFCTICSLSMFVSDALRAVFCTICSLSMFVSDALGDHMIRLQTTQPTSGGAVTVVSSSCANCVEPPRPQQWGPDLPFFGHADPLDGWRCCSQKRVMSRPIQVRQL